MPATRLLVIADPKLLPTLAAGLREAGRFDVVALPLADLANAAAAIAGAEALALFYGTPERPLAAALQGLAAPLRERGGRVIGVLQRDQIAQRDDCFRAGASELLYMPMPKDQFVARLQGAVQLSYPDEQGPSAAVSVATRTTTVELPARVTPDGVHGDRELAFKAGETVRLSWPGFQAWGIVVRGGPGAQVRFAGLWPEDEAQLREWLKTQSSAGAAPVELPPSSPAARAAPAAGPPPGFADRKPIKAQSSGSVLRAPARITPPVISPNGAGGASSPPPVIPAEPSPAVLTPASSPPVSAAPPEAVAPGAVAVRRPAADGVDSPTAAEAPLAAAAAPEGASPPLSLASVATVPAPEPSASAGSLAGLFDEATQAPASVATPEAAAAPAGPSWPHPASPELSRAAAVKLLTDKDKPLPADLPAEVAAAARKIVGGLSSIERAALEKDGYASPLADALTARIVLDAARTEGAKLYSSVPPALVDQPAFLVIIQLADGAATRLQKEADAAIAKGEVEALQLITGGSAALSRDLLSFKETADRLRGKGAAPRLGAGALDPDILRPGQAPRPSQTRAPSAEQAPLRAELRDFASLDDSKPKRGLRYTVMLLSVLFIAAASNAIYFFAVPRTRELPIEAAGPGVQKIQISEKIALVTVTKSFLEHYETEAPPLLEVLRSRGVEKAALTLESGAGAGMIDLLKNKVTGLPVMGEVKKAAAPPPAPH